MSVQNATAFLHRLYEDTALAERIQSKDDAVQLGAELGTPFSENELDQAAATMNAELSSEELMNASGGFKACTVC